MTVVTPLVPDEPLDLPVPPGRSGAAVRAADAAAFRILLGGADSGQLVHLEQLEGRPGRAVPWPGWVPAELVDALGRRGVSAPWAHQAAAAEHARAGRSVIMATGTASGKSLGYLMPALTGVMEGGTALYLSPTRALAADQLQLVQDLAVPGVRPAVIDSDTPASTRSWARSRATYLLTTPDMLHCSLLPRHAWWNGFLRRLRYVIVDECHGYRGVFGSHVAHVLRRLRRIAAHHAGAEPVFILASATISEPASCAGLLTGLPATAVTADGAPRGPLTFCLWEPPLTGIRGEAGAPVRRSATTEAARLLADLVAGQVPALAFVRSRRGAEAVALAARHQLAEAGAAPLAGQVAAYRSGYLAEDRRELEAALRSGGITGLASTTALELGVNIAGLQAVLIAGWPGTRAALWQQAGRAGRDGRGAIAVLIARADPLDTYLVHHPAALLDRAVEATVLDPENPYVMAPHLCAAAAELPLTEPDLALFGQSAPAVTAELAGQGILRDRGPRWYLTRRDRGRLSGLRGTGGPPVRIVEASTGRLVGTVDEPSAHVLVHDGAVYPHQGEMYMVSGLDLAGRVALVEAAEPGYATSARERTSIEVHATLRSRRWGEAEVHFGDVLVSRQVLSFVRRRPDTGRIIGEEALDLPVRTLSTRAVWWTISAGQRAALAASGTDLAGAAHAAEHASIGLLPLVAACDRWDVGGVSADPHPATGLLTVFVYDGHEGGSGFAERGFATASRWLAATASAISSCECAAGCPSCIQSPKCGNGNQPLAKHGAVLLLREVLSGGPADLAGQSCPARPGPQAVQEEAKAL
ncbi:MAG TPA: DEAD/DEAH box helicase [Streptosporangiaceae bacterium]